MGLVIDVGEGAGLLVTLNIVMLVVNMMDPVEVE